MRCSGCDREIAPIVEATSGGIVHRCPHEDCGHVWTPESETRSAQTRTQTKPAEPAPQEARRSRETKRQRPINVIAEAKRRLRELNSEIARLRKLEKERDQLKRLLAAAEKPDAQVTSLRAATR